MSIHKKLYEVQASIGAIEKDSTNPFFKSKYFDINKLLSEIKPKLEKQGLLLLQPLTNVGGVSALKTKIIDVESGEIEEDICSLPQNSDPQKMGSIITYFRRYAL